MAARKDELMQTLIKSMHSDSFEGIHDVAVIFGRELGIDPLQMLAQAIVVDREQKGTSDANTTA